MQSILSLHPVIRIILLITFAVAAHVLIRLLKEGTQWFLTRKTSNGVPVNETFTLRYPRLSSLITILVSALTFSIYFITIGLILKEFKVSLTAYLASASVIGLAIGFGSKGLVQDVVTGLTMIFSDALNMEEIIEISGQIGRVKNIGLRFTTIVNLQGQAIYIPNRNIGIIGRFHLDCIFINVDIHLPDELDLKNIKKI
jgi:small conductance mechanosensitive channel